MYTLVLSNIDTLPEKICKKLKNYGFEGIFIIKDKIGEKEKISEKIDDILVLKGIYMYVKKLKELKKLKKLNKGIITAFTNELKVGVNICKMGLADFIHLEDYFPSYTMIKYMKENRVSLLIFIDEIVESIIKKDTKRLNFIFKIMKLIKKYDLYFILGFRKLENILHSEVLLSFCELNGIDRGICKKKFSEIFNAIKYREENRDNIILPGVEIIKNE